MSEIKYKEKLSMRWGKICVCKLCEGDVLDSLVCDEYIIPASDYSVRHALAGEKFLFLRRIVRSLRTLSTLREAIHSTISSSFPFLPRMCMYTRGHRKENLMALYEYRCGDCGYTFEALVLSTDEQPGCPACGSENLEKLFSTFAVSTKASSPPPSAGVPDLCRAQVGATPCPNAGSCGGACGLA